MSVDRAELILEKFTFHNVSINSAKWGATVAIEKNLHSTMFLLIRHPQTGTTVLLQHLHSTMFLLIRQRGGNHRQNNNIYIPQCFY